jgi:hypothetical protein
MINQMASDYSSVFKTFNIAVDGTAACTGNFYIRDHGNQTGGGGEVVRLTINSHGNVGIGGITTNINNTLHVSGSSLVTTFITTPNLISTNATVANVRSTNISTGDLRSTDTYASSSLLIGPNPSKNAVRFISALDNSMAAGSTKFLTFGQGAANFNQAEIGFNYVGSGNNTNSLQFGFFGANNLMSLRGNGNVGIGQSAPAFKLDILDTATTDTARIRNSSANGYATIRYENNALVWNTGVGGSTAAFANKFYIGGPTAGGVGPALLVGLTGGNWGINTETPTNTLHVSGSSLVTTFITTPNLISTNATVTNMVANKYLFPYQNVDGVWLTENWGGSYVGLNTHPFRVYNASLAVGYTSASYSWGTGGNAMIAGNVGIGDSGPNIKLAVVANNVGDTARIRNTNASGFATIQYQNDSLSWYAGVGGSTASDTDLRNKFYIINPASGGVGPSVFVGHTNGNWGINTKTPTSTLQINGSLAKSSGSFDIKHPILPNKRLVHSFIEGPRCDLIYRGRKQLVNGSVVVNIDLECCHSSAGSMSPGTFEALCANPQAFITCNGSFEKVIGTVSGAELTIQSNNPSSNSQIDWIVIAERKDEAIKEWNRTDENGYLITEYDVEPVEEQPIEEQA